MFASLVRKKETTSRLIKILIAYDGSPCADIALRDLDRAGLPREAEAMVLLVADVWLIPADTEARTPDHISPLMQQARATAAYMMDEAQTIAARGAEAVQKTFPNWDVQAQACADSPAWGIVLKAEQWQPNLVVVGSHNRSPIGRQTLGSVSHTVLTQVHCSVRVARSWGTMPGRPLRILVGVDGSIEAEAAVREVTARCWPPGSDIHLISVIDPSVLTAIASGSRGLNASLLFRRSGAPDLNTRRCIGTGNRYMGTAGIVGQRSIDALMSARRIGFYWFGQLRMCHLI